MTEKTHELMTAEEVADFLRVLPRTVSEKYAYKKGFPKFIKVGQKRLWKRTEIMSYIDELQVKAA